MPRRSSWTEAELAALAEVPPNDRAALARYRARFPGHNARAIGAMLLKLRVRGKARDFLGRRGGPDPFPKHRELTDRGTLD